MSDSGWGFASGFLTGTQQQQAITLGQFQIQEAPITMQKEKLALEVAQQSYDAHNKMTQIIQKQAQATGQGPTQITDAAQTLLQMSKAAAESGLPEESIELASKASTMEYQQAEGTYKMFQIAEARQQLVDQLLANVTDEASWRQANATAQLLTGTKSPFADQKYSPELVKSIKAATQTSLEKARIDHENALTSQSKAATELDAVRVKQVQAQTDLIRAREQNLEKNGGEGRVANAKTVSSVGAQLATQFPALAGTDGSAARKVYADSLAIEAENLFKKTPNITMPEAIKRTIKSAADRGDLAGLDKARVNLGASPSKPLPLPDKDGKQSLDPKDYKDNKWYDTPQGPGVWDAARGGFVYPSVSDE